MADHDYEEQPAWLDGYTGVQEAYEDHLETSFRRERLGQWPVETATQISWADIQAAMEKLLADVPPPRALHCGEAVWDQLRELAPGDTGPLGLGAALGGAPLYGVPAHVEHGMRSGRWELREGEKVVQAGDITPDFDGPVVYVAPGHWIGFRVSDQEPLDNETSPREH